MDLTHKILSDYSYYLRIERAMSPNTVDAYSSDLESLFTYLGVEPSLVTTQDVLDYLAVSERLSKRSQSRQLSAFRSFFDWLVLEGDRTDNPCDAIDTPKIGRYLPEVPPAITTYQPSHTSFMSSLNFGYISLLKNGTPATFKSIFGKFSEPIFCKASINVCEERL